MSARLSFGRTLAVAGIVTAVAVPLSAGSAYAGPNPHHPPVPTQSTSQHPMPAPSHTAGHPLPAPSHTMGHPRPGHHPHHSGVTTLRTRMRDAHIQMSATANHHGRTLSTLHAPGSRVAATCWTLGSREHGSSVWYRTVAPARGYISAAEVARPTHPLGRCK